MYPGMNVVSACGRKAGSFRSRFKNAVSAIRAGVVTYSHCLVPPELPEPISEW